MDVWPNGLVLTDYEAVISPDKMREIAREVNALLKASGLDLLGFRDEPIDRRDGSFLLTLVRLTGSTPFGVGSVHISVIATPETGTVAIASGVELPETNRQEGYQRFGFADVSAIVERVRFREDLS